MYDITTYNYRECTVTTRTDQIWFNIYQGKKPIGELQWTRKGWISYINEKTFKGVSAEIAFKRTVREYLK